MIRVVSGVLIAVVASGVLSVRAAEAGAPTETLRGAMDRVFQVLADPALNGPDAARKRRLAVFTIADETFDFGEAARQALGPHWEARTPAERQEFVELFRSLIQRSYLVHVATYSGEKVLYTGEAVDHDRAMVRCTIVTNQGSEVVAHFHMRLGAGDRWRVHDVTVEGVSLVANYRAQFNKILRGSSYRALVQKLRDKQDATEAPAASARP